MTVVGRAIKRLADIVGAALGLVLASLPFVVVWIAIRATSKGPAVFRQERAGRGMKPFTLYNAAKSCTPALSLGAIERRIAQVYGG